MRWDRVGSGTDARTTGIEEEDDEQREEEVVVDYSSGFSAGVSINDSRRPRKAERGREEETAKSSTLLLSAKGLSTKWCLHGAFSSCVGQRGVYYLVGLAS